jgi:hypothetical protein
MTQEEGNILIAEFDGWSIVPQFKGLFYEKMGEDDFVRRDHFEYHSSWDWLHEPYNKFFSLNSDNRNFDFVQRLIELKNAWLSLDILYAFEVLANAIQWYNQTVKQQTT